MAPGLLDLLTIISVRVLVRSRKKVLVKLTSCDWVVMSLT